MARGAHVPPARSSQEPNSSSTSHAARRPGSSSSKLLATENIRFSARILQRSCGRSTGGPSAKDPQHSHQYQRNHAQHDEDQVRADAQPFQQVKRAGHQEGQPPGVPVPLASESAS